MGGERAIIDIGSNTVRLVIYGGPARTPLVRFNEKVTARLGRGVAETGLLAERGMDQALRALARYAAVLRLRGVRDVQTVATAAPRDAANGADFLARVAALGLKPRLLSGEEEALASAHGVMGAFPGARGIVGDLGGGSLELIDVAEGRCSHGTTLPLGTLRLAALREGGRDKFQRRIHRLLTQADWTGSAGQDFYLVGGSWRALARLALHRRGAVIDDPHGFVLLPDELRRLARSLAVGKLEPAIPGVSGSRLGSVPDAAILLDVLVRELRPARLIFSAWGLREGLLMRALNQRVLAQDPLLVEMADFAGMQGVTAAEVSAASKWIGPVIGAAPGDERLLVSACWLGLASARLERNLRSAHAADWALRKQWVGLDARGRAMLAAAVAGHGGQTAVPAVLSDLARMADLRAAAGWGLALRLWRKLGGGTPRALAETELRRTERALVLGYTARGRDLHGESVDKELRNLAAWLGLTAQVE